MEVLLKETSIIIRVDFALMRVKRSPSGLQDDKHVDLI